MDPLDWEKLKGSFLDNHFSLETREEKILEVINILQGVMIMKEYSLKFTQLDTYV